MQDSWNLRYRSLSGQFSHSAMSNSLRSHGLQHARPPCPSPTPGVHSNSCPLSRWCHPPILSSISPLSSCLQSFPALGSFPMSQFFASGGQSIGVWVLASVLPRNIQGWFPLGMTGLISLQSRTLNYLLQHHDLKASILSHFNLHISSINLNTSTDVENFFNKETKVQWTLVTQFTISLISLSYSTFVLTF